MLKLRPYKPCDAQVILSWCKDEVTFRRWTSDRYDTYPITAEDMNKKYIDCNGDCPEPDNFFPMTAFDENGVAVFTAEKARKKGDKVTLKNALLYASSTAKSGVKKTGTFYLLQIRPMVDVKADLSEDLNLIPEENLILKSFNSLGHGIMEDVFDIVYVKTEGYTASNNQLIAYEIEKLNRKFLEENKHYVLVGPGRWGSSDTWLGIPVKWPHISAARVIVEAGLTNYRVDPSQGTHFFQNLTSFGVGYFTINAYMNDGIYSQDFLDAQPAVEETKYLRHIRFEKPMIIKMDGKKKLGVVMMPEDK